MAFIVGAIIATLSSIVSVRLFSVMSNRLQVGFTTDEDMVIVRDSVSGDWLVEDYAREAVLFHMPRDCSSNEVRRAAALYAAAFKSGFEQGRFVARSTSSLG
jgi:hypothetical protein